MVVLNSCDSAKANATDRFSSTAATLTRRGIPAVVAMQYEITDQAAITFSRGFYTAVAAQHPVELAVTRARRAIKLTRHNTLEWATPVLYLRSPTGSLFNLTQTPTTPRTPETTHSNTPTSVTKPTPPNRPQPRTTETQPDKATPTAPVTLTKTPTAEGSDSSGPSRGHPPKMLHDFFIGPPDADDAGRGFSPSRSRYRWRHAQVEGA
jgi:hypothetical protein